MPPSREMRELRAPFSLLDSSNPIIQLLQRFLSSRNFTYDLTKVTSILAVFKILLSAINYTNNLNVYVADSIQKFCMASISVSARDELYDQIMTWLSIHTLTRPNMRLLNARTKSGDHLISDRPSRFTPATRIRRGAAIEYMPAFVKRSRNAQRVAKNETLTVMCMSWSTKPIKALFETCRDYANKQREKFVTIRTCKSQSYQWEIRGRKPIRHLSSVHLDEEVKASLVEDLRNYLDPKTQKYYSSRGIPYRRGYLLHGPPGTGKTSLSLALAGQFELDLYILDMGTVTNDGYLEMMFAQLPPYCLLLLEDIDAVGMKRKPSDEKIKEQPCSLSALLNALDGVASQEGRVVLMTSNLPDELDEALLRPGRVDRKIYLGHINREGAEQMMSSSLRKRDWLMCNRFLRMFQRDDDSDDGASAEPAVQSATPASTSQPSGNSPTVHDVAINDTDSDSSDSSSSPGIEDDVEELEPQEEETIEATARRFAAQIPLGVFTPAQIQEYLLQHHRDPLAAADQISLWVQESCDKAKAEKPTAAGPGN
ncbi:P-loop containing nucleoside triphosphate hydrolase protein [Whalleya microplaca]|nr:P-loop containing nucleoside triphosphate hydrolase protein [Whalleya microplaca]